MNPCKRSFAFLLALAFLGAQAGATLIAADNFTASSGSNVGTVNNTESSGVGTYTTVQGTLGMTVTTAAGFGSGNVLSLANGTQTYYRPFDGATTLTLNSLAVGETLSLGFDIRFDGSFAGADNFSFGFANFSTPNSILYANLDLSASGGLASELKYRTGSFNMSDAGGSIILGSSFTEPATVTATGYTMRLDVTKQSGGGIVAEYFRDGSSVGSTTQASGSTFVTTLGGADISGIAFRHANTPNVVTYLDNVTVSVIPEPAAGLLLLGGAALIAARRRRGSF